MKFIEGMGVSFILLVIGTCIYLCYLWLPTETLVLILGVPGFLLLSRFVQFIGTKLVY